MWFAIRVADDVLDARRQLQRKSYLEERNHAVESLGHFAGLGGVFQVQRDDQTVAGVNAVRQGDWTYFTRGRPVKRKLRGMLLLFE